MAQRYIYLDEELNQKLKQEPNASELIRNVLNEHYRERGTTVVEKDLQLEVVELQKTIEQKQTEIEEMKVQEKIDERTEEEKAEFKKRNDEATRKLRNAILEELQCPTETISKEEEKNMQ